MLQSIHTERLLLNKDPSVHPTVSRPHRASLSTLVPWHPNGPPLFAKSPNTLAAPSDERECNAASETDDRQPLSPLAGPPLRDERRVMESTPKNRGGEDHWM
jgi:hypothetical protein